MLEEKRRREPFTPPCAAGGNGVSVYPVQAAELVLQRHGVSKVQKADACALRNSHSRSIKSQKIITII